MSLILSGKGISPIVATILLLMMAVAIASSAFFWTSRMQNQMQGSIEAYHEKQLTQLTTSAKIYDADYNSTSKNLTILIRNAGNTRLPIRDCCFWPRTDWILRNSNQATICATDWVNICKEGCTGDGTVSYIDIGQIYKVVLNLESGSAACNISSYSSGEVFSFSINFLGQTTAGGSFTK